MTNTAKLLEAILKGAQMGAFAIEQLSEESQDSQFGELLKNQRKEYLKILNDAKTILRDNGREPVGLNIFAYKASVISVKMNVRAEKSVQHFAQMMITGSTMGINKLTEAYRKYYTNASSEAKELAKCALKTEINNVSSLLDFLD